MILSSSKSKNIKGILKNKNASTDIIIDDKIEKSTSSNKIATVQWDEENVKATFHPEDKDYGHMKINEPATPYEPMTEYEEESDQCSSLDQNSINPLDLSLKLEEANRKVRIGNIPDKQLSPEQLEHNRKFESLRKQHYDEYSKIQQARKLMEEEGLQDDE